MVLLGCACGCVVLLGCALAVWWVPGWVPWAGAGFRAPRLVLCLGPGSFPWVPCFRALCMFVIPLHWPAAGR